MSMVAGDCTLPLCSSGAIVVCSTPYTGEANARGVFATRDIPRGTLLEVAHCLRFTKHEHDDHAMKTVLQHYTFCAGGGDYFLALGLGSLFNHADPPNVEFRVNRTQETISYFACRDVAAGDELCIFYGKNLWFVEHSNADKGACTTSSTKMEQGEDAFTMPFSGDDFD